MRDSLGGMLIAFMRSLSKLVVKHNAFKYCIPANISMQDIIANLA